MQPNGPLISTKLFSFSTTTDLKPYNHLHPKDFDPYLRWLSMNWLIFHDSWYSPWEWSSPASSWTQFRSCGSYDHPLHIWLCAGTLSFKSHHNPGGRLLPYLLCKYGDQGSEKWLHIHGRSPGFGYQPCLSMLNSLTLIQSLPFWNQILSRECVSPVSFRSVGMHSFL